MMTSSSCWVVCVAVVAMAALISSTHVQPIQDSEVAEVPERLRELLLIRRLISSLSGGEALPVAQPAIRKRTCYINAGLSHGCDYKDLVGAMAEKTYWDSLSSPGRRRRRRQAAAAAAPEVDEDLLPQHPDFETSASLELSQEGH